MKLKLTISLACSVLLIGATTAKAATVYRNYNSKTGEHLYTANSNEWNQLPHISYYWNQDSVTFDEPASGAPVYRVYNPHSGEHLFTGSKYERDSLVKTGWNSEGIAFYSGGKIPVYRLYNPNSGQHLDTASGYEKSVLVAQKWRDEGVAWHAISQGSVAVPPKPKAPDTPVPPHAKAPVYFSQLNPQWSGVPLGTSTVGPAGCVATSLAMILRGSYGVNVDPGTVALRADAILGGPAIGFGLSGSQLRAIANSYGHSVITTANNNDTISYLKAGYPVIIDVNVGIGHAVVVWGYNNGTVQVLDPYAREFFPSGYTTLNYLTSILSPDHVNDWNIGRPVFVIK